MFFLWRRFFSTFWVEKISEFLFFWREVKARRVSRDAAPRRGRGGGGRGGGGRERGVWR